MTLAIHETIMTLFVLALLVIITAVKETREAFFILFRSDVEILADSLAPVLIISHLFNFLFVGKRVGRLGRAGRLFGTALPTAFLPVLKPSGVHVNVGFNQSEHTPCHVGQVFRHLAEQRILADGRINLCLHIGGHTLDSLIEAAVEYETLTVHKSDFLNADTMHGKHEFPLDYIFLCSHTFGVLHDSLPSIVVGIDKVGDISAGALDQHADRFAF